MNLPLEPAQARAALAQCTLSVNEPAHRRVQTLIERAPALGIGVQRDPSGVCVIDAGIHTRGSVEAGVLIAEICLGGWGQVRQVLAADTAWPRWLEVHSAQPVLACLGSQYAGWSLSASKEETGGKKFFALGSGPARALACKEPLFAELGYRDTAEHGVLVLEVDRVPPPVVIDKVLQACALAAEQLTVILTPTASLAGTTQVVARVLEVALHKAHELGFPLGDIVEGAGRAPLPAPAADGVEAMGRTNDAILYGGSVQLSVTGDLQAARALARDLPSCNSRDYGQGFARLFAQADFDFYKLDPALFAPAQVWVSHLPSGQTWQAGHLDLTLLTSQWLSKSVDLDAAADACQPGGVA